MARCLVEYVEEISAEGKTALGKTEARHCTKAERNLLSSSGRHGIQRNHAQMRERSWNCKWFLQCRANCQRSQGNPICRRFKTHKRKFATSTGREKSSVRHRRETKLFTNACISEADESTRKRIQETQNRDHEDHFAEKGYKSMNHFNLVHKPYPMPQRMKIPDAKSCS